MKLVHSFKMKKETEFPDHVGLRCRIPRFWDVSGMIYSGSKSATIKYKHALLAQEDLKLQAVSIPGKCVTTFLQVLIRSPVHL